jgi:tetratricopeptide (TPR) repeat protein
MSQAGWRQRLRKSDSRLLWWMIGVLAGASRYLPWPALTLLYVEASLRRGNLRRAAHALEFAAGRHDCAEWAFRAGELHFEAKSDVDAVRSFGLAVQLDPEPALHHYWLARALESARDFPAAANSYEHAVARDPRRSWLLRLGRARVRVGTESAACSAVACLEEAVERDPDNGMAFYWLARARVIAGDAAGAMEALQSALHREHARSAWPFEVATAFEEHGTPRIVNDAVLGLVRAVSPDWQRVAQCYRLALELDPEKGRYHYRYGLAQGELGELENGVRSLTLATELGPPNAHWHYRLGMAMLRLGGQRPLLEDERLAAADAFVRALQIDPSHDRARRQLVNARIGAGDWGDASRTAWPPETRGLCKGTALEAVLRFIEIGDPRPHVERVLEAVGEFDAGTISLAPRPFWVTLHCRLLSLGQFSAAYDVKSLLAAAAVAAVDESGASRAIELERARALAYLARTEEAIRGLDAAARDAQSLRQVQTCQKVAGDLALSQGDIDRYLSLSEFNKGANEAVTERRFRELVEGRSVAIVGPAATDAEHGEEIDAFDVVVRTTHLSGADDDASRRAARGVRTDIAYYASTTSGIFGAEIRGALERGALSMAIFRPSTRTPHLSYLVRPGDLRFVPSEFKGGFMAGPMGILRIVYDLLRYRPARVKVFNIDFFLSPKEYGSDHELQARVDERWRELGVVAARALAHDYLSDFRFTRTLHQANLIETTSEVAALLKMSPEQYLSAMDERRSMS